MPDGTELAVTNDFSYEMQPAVLTADFAGMQARLDKLIEPYKDLTAEIVAEMNMQDAKRCRADLNAISKNLNDARKAIKREYNKPLEEFEAKVKELDDQILAPQKLLDAGIKKRENVEKEQLRENLEQVYFDFAPALADLVPFDSILDPRWLNKSYGEKKAVDSLCDKVAGINADWNTLKGSHLNFPEETERRFFESLSLRDALSYDSEQKERQDALNAMKSEVEENRAALAASVEPPTEPNMVMEQPESPKIRLSEDEAQYRFSLRVDAYFITNVNEATALKNHLELLGIPYAMTKSKEAVHA